MHRDRAANNSVNAMRIHFSHAGSVFFAGHALSSPLSNCALKGCFQVTARLRLLNKCADF